MAPNRPGVIEQISVTAGELAVVLDGGLNRLGSSDTIVYRVRTAEYRNDARLPCSFVLLSDSSRAAGR